MSMQANIKAWLTEVKQILAEPTFHQTWVSIPLLQSWLSCSYSQALMLRDAMIKDGIIEADAEENSNRYNLTPAYIPAHVQAEPTPTPEVQEQPQVSELDAEVVEASVQESAPQPVTETPATSDTVVEAIEVQPQETATADVSPATTVDTVEGSPVSTPDTQTTETPPPPAEEKPAEVTPPPVKRPMPQQQTIEMYDKALIDKYTTPEAKETFCIHIWQNMLQHLCVKGFNDITGKYLPTLAEKQVMPPVLAAYIENHPMTPDTPCLPLSVSDIQTSIKDFGLFATVELCREQPALGRREVMDIITERVRCLRNMYILSNEAIDGYQAMRNALRNSTDEAFDAFKAML